MPKLPLACAPEAAFSGGPGLADAMASAVVSLLAGVVGAAFAAAVAAQWVRARRPYQLAWGLGLAAYGAAALVEAAGIAWGWSEPLYRAYFPLAAANVGLLGLGTILLVAPRRAAAAGVVLVSGLVLVATLGQFLVDIDPVTLATSDPGADPIPRWTAARVAFLLLNVAGGLALIGGAFWSWWRTRRAGVLLIGVGALLPFMGGSLSTIFAFDARALLQFVGIAVMFVGYLQGREARRPAAAGEPASS